MLADKIQELALFSISIFLQAMPFLLLAVLLAAFFHAYVPDRWIEKVTPKYKPFSALYGLFLSAILPVCECGVVPVTRMLLQRKFPATLALTFMLSAPVINPIVVATTYIAFHGDLEMLVARLAIVIIVAVVTALIISSFPGSILRPDYQSHAHSPDCGCGCGTAAAISHQGHSHSADCNCGEATITTAPHKVRVKQALQHASSDFMQMGAYLIGGALAAGLIKAFFPMSVLGMFQANVFLSVVSLMALAVVLSVCSESDSFVAASLINFPRAAQLSFITVGPMLDLKLIAMHLGTFNRRTVLALASMTFLLNLLLCTIYGFIRG